MAKPTMRVWDVRRYIDGKWGPSEPDRLTVEEPLEIRVAGSPLVVIMRTPGNDEALAAGFLLTEGIVERAEEIFTIEPGRGERPEEKGNVVEVRLAEGVEFDRDRFARAFFANSSCGICGKGSIEEVSRRAGPLGGRWSVEPALITKSMEAMRAGQAEFAKTGSLHGAALFDLEGGLIGLAEDVGRHNAVDKVIGRAALERRLPLDRTFLTVSGRIAFEIAQKALVAGIPLVAAVSGASSLAVELAEEQGMTLVGFTRGGALTVYHGGRRIDGGDV